MVASCLFPPPLIYQNTLDEEKSIKIVCVAPKAYTDAWFYLLRVGQAQPVQKQPAAETQHHVTFLLEHLTTRNGDQYKCQYGLINGSQLQQSELSRDLDIVLETSNLTTTPTPGPDLKGPAWVLPTVLSVTGVLLLVVVLVVAVIAIGHFAERRKKRRELESCWTETSYPKSETSFDICVYTVSVKTEQEADDWTSSTRSRRLTSNSSLGKPDFCTFRALE
ncbi:protein HIDE1-like isoform X2 [Hemicordylus capensis]|nr:protein HIDE1-like isoform X2 [Hemicordylus capensis]XP_053147788.1 protein HIDE1-like isoform X2 [Hemicordylus capensis]XP_053147789.1 protein HIDE1-like isoform X2 [Hemicordylus capensis]